MIPIAFTGEVMLTLLGCPYALHMCFKKEDENRPRIGAKHDPDTSTSWAWDMTRWAFVVISKWVFILVMWSCYPLVLVWEWVNGTIIVFIRLFCNFDENDTGSGTKGTSMSSNTLVSSRTNS